MRPSRIAVILASLMLLAGSHRPARAQDRDQRRSPLEELVVDLTKMARDGKLDPAFAVDEPVDELRAALTRAKKSAVVLLGRAGTGKTAVVEELARRVAAGQVPEFKGYAVWQLDVGSLVAGAHFRGMFEERLQQLADAVRDKPVLVFIDELHGMVGAGKSTANQHATGEQLLKPIMARAGKGRIIGATTIEEFAQIVAGDGALARRLTPVFIEEPTAAQTLRILGSLKPTLERHHNIVIRDGALRAAVRLGRFIPDQANPDKGITLVDHAAAAAQVADQKEIGPRHIAAVVRRWLATRALTAEREGQRQGRAGRPAASPAPRRPNYRTVWQHAHD